MERAAVTGRSPQFSAERSNSLRFSRRRAATLRLIASRQKSVIYPASQGQWQFDFELKWNCMRFRMSSCAQTMPMLSFEFNMILLIYALTISIVKTQLQFLMGQCSLGRTPPLTMGLGFMEDDVSFFKTPMVEIVVESYCSSAIAFADSVLLFDKYVD
jgi:hypothetical protein